MLAVVALAAAPAAQQKPPAAQQKTPVFRSNVELINVDVVVSDKDGNAVRGLTQTDFALTDRKKLQTVSTFEEVSHERATAAPSPTTMFPASLRMDVVDNQSSQADRLILMLVDDLHIWKGRTDKARQLARDVVTTLGAQASMAVIFTSGENSTQVTPDRSELITAINKMQGRQSVRRPHQAVDDQKGSRIDPGEKGVAGGDAFGNAALDQVRGSMSSTLQDFEDNMRQLQALKDAAAFLRPEDKRRKAFVLISEGMAKDMSGIFDNSQSPCELGTLKNPGNAEHIVDFQSTCYHDRALRDAMESMRRSNVTTYAIDPRGKVKPEDMALELFPPPDCAACSAGGSGKSEDSGFRWENAIRVAQDSLGQLTSASGGFAVTDTDDFAPALKKIVEDLDHYYLLGFYPADSSGGDKYRPLDVTVPAHPDWTIRFRRGYTPGATETPVAPKDPMAALASGVMPKSDLPLRITALPLVGKGKNANVAIALEVTTPTGIMRDADNKLRDDVSYSVLVVDDKKAKVTSRTGRAASFAMSAKDANAAMPDSVTYQIPLTIDLPPGVYQLRASATSKKLGQGGSVYLGLTVPDFNKEPLLLSGIVLGYADGSHVPVGRKPTTAAGTSPIAGAGSMMGSSRPTTTTSTVVAGGMAGAVAKGTTVNELPQAQAEAPRLPFDPALTREFSNTDVLRTYFEVARKNTASTVALTIMILDANNKPVMAIDKSVGPNDAGKVDLRMPLGPLGPGAYRIRVTGTDTRSVATTETGIVIR